MQESNTAGANEPNATELSSRLQSVDFFIPLPQAVPLPHECQLNLVDIDDGSVEDTIRYIDSGGLAKRIKTRIQFYRLPTDFDYRASISSFLAADKFYQLSSSGSPSALSEGGYATVAHVAVIGKKEELTEDLRTEYFDKALIALRSFLKTYYAVHRTLLTLPSRQNLPAIIAHTTEDIDSNGNPTDTERVTLEISAFLTGGPIDMFVSDEPDQSPDQFALLSDRNIIETSEVMQQYMDVYREACAAEVNGEYISASILFAAAAEIYLDLLLLLMIWEEGSSPEKAFAELFQIKRCECEDCTELISTTFERVKSGMYAERIGGNWNVYKAPMMKGWQAVRYTRNEAVHSGLEPSEEEIKNVHKVVDDLVSWTIDLLVDYMDKYPIALFFLAGRASIERRGAWGKYESLDKGDVPVSIAHVFANWRREVMRLHPHDKTKSTKDTSCNFVYLLHQNGKKYWLLCDFKKRLFRYLPDQEIASEVSKMLDETEKKFVETGKKKSILIQLDQVPWKSDNRPHVWHPLYLASTEYAISRYPVNYMLPRTEI